MNVTSLLAHPDDEIMCAGTLAKFVDAGDHVTLITAFSDDERTHELHQCAKILGASLIELFGKQLHFTWNQESVRHYEPIVAETNPDHLISHRVADNNTSHVPLALIMRTIARKNNVPLWEIDSAMPGGIEANSSTNNLLVDIDAQVDRKYRAIESYASVNAQYPGWNNAIKHRDLLNGWLLHMDGASHYAEALRIHKSVWL